MSTTHPTSSYPASHTTAKHLKLVPVSELAKMSQQELEALFNALPDTDTAGLCGVYKGKVYGVKGIQSLPRFLRAAITRCLHTPLPLWLGKRFSGDSGSNLWFNPFSPIPYGYYRIRNPESGHPLQLDYHVDKNHKAMHPILGEVKNAGEDFFLARMLYRKANTSFCVLYFTLDLKHR